MRWIVTVPCDLHLVESGVIRPLCDKRALKGGPGVVHGLRLVPVLSCELWSSPCVTELCGAIPAWCECESPNPHDFRVSGLGEPGPKG